MRHRKRAISFFYLSNEFFPVTHPAPPLNIHQGKSVHVSPYSSNFLLWNSITRRRLPPTNNRTPSQMLIITRSSWLMLIITRSTFIFCWTFKRNCRFLPSRRGTWIEGVSPRRIGIIICTAPHPRGHSQQNSKQTKNIRGFSSFHPPLPSQSLDLVRQKDTNHSPVGQTHWRGPNTLTWAEHTDVGRTHWRGR